MAASYSGVNQVNIRIKVSNVNRSYTPLSFEGHEGLQPIPADIGEEAGPLWTGRQGLTGPTHRDKQAFTPMDNSRVSSWPIAACAWTVGGSRSYPHRHGGGGFKLQTNPPVTLTMNPDPTLWPQPAARRLPWCPGHTHIQVKPQRSGERWFESSRASVMRSFAQQHFVEGLQSDLTSLNKQPCVMLHLEFLWPLLWVGFDIVQHDDSETVWDIW